MWSEFCPIPLLYAILQLLLFPRISASEMWVSLRSPLLPHNIIFHTFTHCSWLFFSRSIWVYSYFFQSWRFILHFAQHWVRVAWHLFWNICFYDSPTIKNKLLLFLSLFFFSPYHTISSYWSCGQLNSLRLPTRSVLSRGTHSCNCTAGLFRLKVIIFVVFIVYWPQKFQWERVECPVKFFCWI